MEYCAHDLLWLDGPDAFAPVGERPAWLDDEWLAWEPVVMRRDLAPAGHVPVGVRGLERNQRCAGHVPAGRVTHSVTPAMLARSLAGRTDDLQAAARDWPCIAALLSVAPRLDALGLEWGPVGGAAFWLATGLPVLRPTSDLDLMVRSPTALDRCVLAALVALQASVSCRLDIQVDTGIGGFALTEYTGGAQRVLLKTARGPLLLANPWMHTAAA